jgi:hypothetical protein
MRADDGVGFLLDSGYRIFHGDSAMGRTQHTDIIHMIAKHHDLAFMQTITIRQGLDGLILGGSPIMYGQPGPTG